MKAHSGKKFTNIRIHDFDRYFKAMNDPDSVFVSGRQLTCWIYRYIF